ncbi:M20/M25/M40 family metallo-hydrolase [Terrarubrum flagellatum]|uniref:M20/M25/M40 family metallo-hydrolase n=1 Tax=Terrirubrum flagellatum TaxID=2895980 RepID=UPI0031456AA9
MAAIDNVLNHIDAHLDQSLERLFSLLRIPSVSTDSAYAADVRRAAEFVAEDVSGIGFEAKIHDTPGHPVVVGHAKGGKKPHILFYGHYDVQPVDPLHLWEFPPFEPKLVDLEPGRKVIRARGACDDKGQMMTFIEACRAWKAATGELPIDISLLLEGEEENGSESLPGVIKANRKALKADHAFICDTGQWDRDTPAITITLRGMFHEEIIVRTADRDLHSGSFGGAANNAIRVLSRVVADLHDEDGRIGIPGFYKGVKELPKPIYNDWKKLNLTAKKLLGPIGLSIPAGEKDRMVIEQIASRPTCDVNGVWAGYQGEGVKTVIPNEAHAKVSFRLAAGQDPENIQKLFRKFVTKRIPKDCSVEFVNTKWTTPANVPWDSDLVVKARDALTTEWNRKAVLMGQGGSIPIVKDFKETLGLEPLLIGFALKDDRVHAPNEKYDLSSFHKGIRSWARILGAMAK